MRAWETLVLDSQLQVNRSTKFQNVMSSSIKGKKKESSFNETIFFNWIYRGRRPKQITSWLYIYENVWVLDIADMRHRLWPFLKITSVRVTNMNTCDWHRIHTSSSTWTSPCVYIYILLSYISDPKRNFSKEKWGDLMGKRDAVPDITYLLKKGASKWNWPISYFIF